MKQHTDWLKARLAPIPGLRTAPGAVPSEFVKVFVSRAEYPPPNQTVKVLPPYIVLHPVDGNAERPRLSGGRRRKSPRWTVHSVGANADQAIYLGAAVEARLIPRGIPGRPVIAGENTFPIWWNSPTPVDVDDDAKPPVFLHNSECGFDTELITP